MRSKKNFIQGMNLMKGAMHSELGVPMEKKIPSKTIEKAAHSSNKLLKKRAVFAKTLKGFRRG